MKIEVSQKSIHSALAKGLFVLLSFWIVVVLIFLIVNNYTGYWRIIEGMDNTQLLFILFLASLIIVSLITMFIAYLNKIGKELVLEDEAITYKTGITKPKITKFPYSDIKEARTLPASLRFIDDLFSIGGIIIEGEKVIIMSGVFRPEVIVSEINKRVSVVKRKGMAIEELTKEVKELREEIESLKRGRISKPQKKEVKKGKFEIGPLEEGM